MAYSQRTNKTGAKPWQLGRKRCRFCVLVFGMTEDQIGQFVFQLTFADRNDPNCKWLGERFVDPILFSDDRLKFGIDAQVFVDH